MNLGESEGAALRGAALSHVRRYAPNVPVLVAGIRMGWCLGVSLGQPFPAVTN
jgi:hypothetical protein